MRIHSAYQAHLLVSGALFLWNKLCIVLSQPLCLILNFLVLREDILTFLGVRRNRSLYSKVGRSLLYPL